MDTMQAVVFHGPHDVRVEEMPRPEIEEPGDVLLKVDRAAICGTDLHPYSGRMEMEEGATLGHEYLGTIEAKGDGVTEFEEGERAVGSFFVACGKCWFCRRGLYMKCMMIRVFGMGFVLGDLNGAQAQYVRVPEADLTLRKLPEPTSSSTTRTCCSSATSSRPATTPCARPTSAPATWSPWWAAGPWACAP